MSNPTVQMFNLPNLFTAANLICGVLSIFLGISGQLEIACLFIYAAAVFDFFDGFLARKLKVSSELGKQLDSLADMVTFGVAPGVLMTLLLIIFAEGGVNMSYGGTFSEIAHTRINSFLSTIASGDFGKVEWTVFLGLIITFFSLFRLAKFNIDTRQSESFIGLPTPANTIFFTAFPLLLAQAFRNGDEGAIIISFLNSFWFIVTIVVMSVLLVSEIPLFSLKFKDFSWGKNQIRFIFLGCCAVLIPILFAWSIPIIIILYLLLSIIENYRKKSAA